MTGKSRAKTEEDELDSLLTSEGHAGVKTDGKSQTKADMAEERGAPSVKARMTFLETVVRGRGTATQRFKDWFPDFSKGSLGSGIRWLRGQLELPYWQNQNVPLNIPSEDIRQAYEEILRYKLRVVWHRAIAGDSPQIAAARIRHETRGLQHFTRRARGEAESKPGQTKWVQKTESALMWLEYNTHKLRLCAIADCKSPYFIASASRKKYCSDYCQEIAEVERSKERVRIAGEAKKAGQGSKPSRLTPEGRERIVRGVKKRWEKRRRQKGRSKKV
jgi:hypothetical protein